MYLFLFTGSQHLPLLQQHLGNVEKQISRRYGDLAAANQSLLLDIVQQKNELQLQNDLAKLLMSIKQGFVHIIVYDAQSVGTAIADALEHRVNMRVYYPKGEGVGNKAVIDQFVTQLLFRDGSCRSSSSPCAHFELVNAFSTMCNDKTLKMLDDDDADDEEDDADDEENDADDEEDGNMEDKGK